MPHVPEVCGAAARVGSCPEAPELPGISPRLTSGRASPAASMSPRRQRLSLLGSGSSSSTPAGQPGPTADLAGRALAAPAGRAARGTREELSRLPSDVSAMLKEAGIAEQMALKQKHGRSAKVRTD